MRILADTNIFLEYILNREHAREVEKFFILCHQQNHWIYTTSMSLRDIGYAVHRSTHNQSNAKEAQQAVYEMVNKVIGISADDAIESLYTEMTDYEDSLIVEAAKSEMLDAIVTLNMRDFKKADFPIFSLEKINTVLSK